MATKKAQIDTFYAQGDFGYVRDQRNEMMMICEPLFLVILGEFFFSFRNDSCVFLFLYILWFLQDDSSFECSEHLRFCRGRNVMINFTDLAHRNEPIRYKMDVLKEGQIGGYCT